MSENMILFSWSAFLTVSGFLVGFILHGVKEDVSKLWTAHEEIRNTNLENLQHYNNYYVRRDDYLSSQHQIMEFLRRIDDKLDRKVDK